VLSLRDQVRRI